MLPLLVFFITCFELVVTKPLPPYQRPRQLDNSFPDGLIEGSLGALAGALGISASYDYIVVGGGTGGTATAVRLAESGASVALIEAGEYYEIGEAVLGSTPSGDVVFVGSDPTDSDPLVDWEFVAENQPGTNNRPIHYARGKCLGGSSALNFMIYQRPTVESFQQWAELVDDDSYTFDNLLPYYKRSPQFTPPNTATRAPNATAEYNPDAFSPNGGPLQVSYPNYAQPFSSWMAAGLHDIGIEDIEDFNSGKIIGSQYCSTTIRPSDETRSSSDASFLQSALDSTLTNLKVYTGTLAKQVLFDENKKAVGVQVESLGVVYTLNATKEVIVSCGAFQSPQLLMVSGIGPAANLEPLGIEVVSDLPGVGQNMWDHVFFGPTYPVNLITLTKAANDPVYLTEQLALYTITHTGALTNNVADYLGWEKIPQHLRSTFTPDTEEKLSRFPSDWPEVEYLSGAGYIGAFTNLFLTQPKTGQNYASMLATLITPSSRGNVTIVSTSTTDLPIINPAWLTDPADQQVIVAAFKRAREAFNSDAMQPIVTGAEYYPGPDVQTDEEILEVARNSLMTLWHAACTCKMGNSSDEMAVLDSEARVRGVSRLRVVDASAFPILVPGHPQSTVYMLAEKISELILRDNA